MKLSGHKKYDTFKKYVRLSLDEYADDIAKNVFLARLYRRMNRQPDKNRNNMMKTSFIFHYFLLFLDWRMYLTP